MCPGNGAVDPAANSHDPGTQAPGDVTWRARLEDAFVHAPGSNVEKLENFTKYVPRQTLARFLTRYELFKLVADVQGSIVECGVLQGGGLMGFAQLSAILEPYNFQRRLFGFDTWTGFTNVSEQDLRGTQRKSGHLKQGGFAAPDAHDDLLTWIELYDQNRLLNHFPKVKLIRGDFGETIARFLEEHPHVVISLLYLDFDVYEPTRIALERFLPRVPKGGVVVFDELNEETFPGETIALLEKSGSLHGWRVRRFPFEPRISYAVIGD
jgi:hypothetical protein